jgi:hypothetical protein
MTQRLPSFRPRLHRPLAAALVAAGILAAGSAGASDSPFDYQQVGATLAYSIEISGQAHSSSDRGSVWSKNQLSRHLQGTLHLAGQQTQMARLENAQEQIARTAPARQALAADMPTIQRIADECGDDDACLSARMMKLMGGMSADKRAAVVSATKGPAATFSQHRRADWAVDGKTACSIQATSRASSSYRAAAGGEGISGYVTGSEERQGQGHSDCRHDPIPRGRAHWNGDTGLLDLELPGLALVEQWKRGDGKRGTEKIEIPDVELEQLHWSGTGPQSGQQVRHVTAAGVPATMTIRWTFTPNRS